jgi:hypothetical protein
MTEEEFNNTKWGANMEMRYKGKIYPIAAVDFEERLIAYPCDNFQEMSWVRCENVKVIEINHEPV